MKVHGTPLRDMMVAHMIHDVVEHIHHDVEVRTIHDVVVHTHHGVEVHMNHEDQFDDIAHVRDTKRGACKVLEARGIHLRRDEEEGDKTLHVAWEEGLCNLFRYRNILRCFYNHMCPSIR